MLTPTLFFLGAACILVRLTHLSAERIQQFRLRQLAIITLIAAASTPTTDLLNDLLLALPLFAAYLAYDWVTRHFRVVRKTAG